MPIFPGPPPGIQLPGVPELLDATEQLFTQSTSLAALALGSSAQMEPHDPLGLAESGWGLYWRMWGNPLEVMDQHTTLMIDYFRLANRIGAASLGLSVEPLVEPDPGDRRFKDELWEKHPVFSAIKQSYLLTARAWIDLVGSTEGLDEREREKLLFATQQVVDALAPTNFPATNPQVLKETLATNGRNLADGVGNFVKDLEGRDGRFSVPMVDFDAFEVGRNLAVSPGQVVFRNELMELIQYAPTTERAHRRALLLIPPWINKYYIMDLRPGNSLVEWLVAQGHTVFMISWVNPDESLAHKGFDDYMSEGLFAALDAIEQATGEREVNVAGYCLGGIVLAVAMAWLAAKGDDRVVSASYLTTMVDYSDPGDVKLFIDEAGLQSLERKINHQGFLDGASLSNTFRALRANDLIWYFYVNNYLLGKAPPAFDLLYWNCDSTNLPASMHTYFMRNMYLENRLRDPGGVEIGGVAIDVGQVRAPAYVLSTLEDHIAPWKATYASYHLFSGPTRFVLSGSGHIAGVINPPHRKKYGYWTSAAKPETPQAWLDGAEDHEGSWWPDWHEWLSQYSGGEVAARHPGDGGLRPLGAAPGTYVHIRHGSDRVTS